MNTDSPVVEKVGIRTGIPSAEYERERLAAEALASSRRAAVFLSKMKPDEELVTVFIVASTQGRVTGWDVECPEHGSSPMLAPSRDAAVTLAGEHLDESHGGRGNVKVKRSRPGRGRGRSRVRGRG